MGTGRCKNLASPHVIGRILAQGGNSPRLLGNWVPGGNGACGLHGFSGPQGREVAVPLVWPHAVFDDGDNGNDDGKPLKVPRR